MKSWRDPSMPTRSLVLHCTISLNAALSTACTIDGFSPRGSTTKLLTVGTALATLGPGYRFRTPDHRTGPLHDGTIDGDLVLVASGDLDLSGRVGHGDTLTFANYDHSYGAGDSAAAAVPGDPLAVIRELATQVAMSGVSRVHGHVLVDATLLSSRGLGERPTDDRSPIVVNDNVIDVTVRPGDREDKPPSVMISPDLGYLVVIKSDAHGSTGNRPDHCPRRRFRRCHRQASRARCRHAPSRRASHPVRLRKSLIPCVLPRLR